MNDVPDMNNFGAARWPNIKEIQGPRGSKGGGLIWRAPQKSFMFMASFRFPIL